MEILSAIYYGVDGFLISFYRLSQIPILGYYIGTGVLCLICVLIGQMTYCWIYRRNHRFFSSDSQEMIHMHNLSIKALGAKNKTAYKSCNKQANDAFGKYFFAQAAIGISSLWPVPFALGWMQSRFVQVDFALPIPLPGFGSSVGFMFTFFPIYVLVYILFGKIKHKLPYFSSFEQWRQASHSEAEEMMSFSDLAGPKAPGSTIS
ncbi:hypothetical protein DSCO28_59640 [Desulfosarcina ovata subsp. sediminis]|uniref:Uncharacterized protein n=1 Tax=Desulfosarcina ovata subsp. sediminis TaxID=885957 RepID=A0A5K7ZYS2_9BACT|nr:hypothetical protein DSCO28_59640 [Desulfosarcina ovata subsp. sediminis]